MRILFHLWLRLPIFVYFFNFYLCFSMREKVEPICVPKKDLNVEFYGKTYNNDANGIINFVDDKTNIECLYDFKCGDCTLRDAINTYENALRKEFAEIGMDCKLSNIVCNQTLDIHGDIDDSSPTYEVCLELEAIFNNSVTVFDHDNNIDITDIYLRYNNGYDKFNNFFDLFKCNKESVDVIEENIYMEKLLSIFGYNRFYIIEKYEIGNNVYEVKKNYFTFNDLKRIIDAFRNKNLNSSNFKITVNRREYNEEDIRSKYEINFKNHRMTLKNFYDKMSSFLDENVKNGIFFYILKVRCENIGKYCPTEFLNDKIKEIDERLKEIDYPIKVEGVGVNDFKFCLDKDNKKSRMIRIGVFEKDTSKELCVFGELFESFFQGSYILVKNRCTYSELRKYICDVFSSINKGNNKVLNNFVFHNGDKEIENENVEIEGNDVSILINRYEVINGSKKSDNWKNFVVNFYYKDEMFYEKIFEFNECFELSSEQLYSFTNKWLEMYSNGEIKNCKIIMADEYWDPVKEITNKTDLNSLITVEQDDVNFRALIDLNTSPLYKKYSTFGGKNIHIDGSNGKTIKNTSGCMCCSSCRKP